MKKNKYIKPIIISSLIALVIIYLAFAFIDLSFNPVYWSEMSRIFYAITSLVAIIILAMVIHGEVFE